MIDKICLFLTNKIQKENPEKTKEEIEVINYGLQLIIGEIPKLFIVTIIAFLLNIGWLTLAAYMLILPYRTASGGFHLKTHIGCVIGTTLFFCGNAYLSKIIVFEPITKYILIGITFIFAICMITLYAPADTENVPIISKKERKKKKILSYIIMTITLLVAVIIKNNTISNILLFGTILQSISITKLAYKLTNNKYGYEVYQQEVLEN